MFYSAMTVSAAKQISLFTTGSHLRDKSLNVGFGEEEGEVERGSIYVTLSGTGHIMQASNKRTERRRIKLLIKLRVV